MGETADRKILDHAGRYRITLRRVIEQAFLDGKASSNVVQRLRQARLLEQVPLDGGVSGYKLTRKGATHLSLPPKRAEAPTPVSLQNCLAGLWFSFLGPRRRHRLEFSEVEQLLGVRPPSGVYCLERDPKPRVYRLYVPGIDTPDQTIRRQVEDRVQEIRKADPLASWAKTRQFALAILVSEERRAQVNRLLKDLTPEVHLLVESVPHPTTLSHWLRRSGDSLEGTE